MAILAWICLINIECIEQRKIQLKHGCDLPETVEWGMILPEEQHNGRVWAEMQ